MPSSLADLRLPTEWIIQYEAFVKKLVTCPLFQVTLAQLYDGRETTMTLLEFGEILRLIEPDVQSHPSDDALRDVKDWLDRQDLGDFHLSDSWSDEIERFFRTSQDTGERVLGLALCVVNPILRWYVRGYWQHLQSLGKSLPQTCQEYHSVDPETAVQQWCEERVWGGLLSLRNGELLVSPLLRSAFVVPNKRLLNLVNETESLPLRPPPSRRRRKRLEDDPVLYNFIHSRDF